MGNHHNCDHTNDKLIGARATTEWFGILKSSRRRIWILIYLDSVMQNGDIEVEPVLLNYRRPTEMFSKVNKIK